MWDVIIVGSGAGGSTLAHRLAGSKLRVLVLERGDYLPRERENWDEDAVGAGRYRAKEEWLDGAGNAFAPYTHYCVGGNTKVYGAALLRMRPSDFDEVRHYDGISPRWPIGYDVFERYYTEAERLYSVHGERGRDPLDPPASAPYPFAPVPHEPRIEALSHELERAGLAPFPLPLGVRLSHTSRAPVSLGLFDGYPDPTESKADAHVSALAPALSAGNVELWTNALALRLTTNESGNEIDGVVVRRGDETLTVRASVVVVSCGAINSAALFLKSASDAHPRGLANRSGLVGRNYMTHHNGALIAASDVPNPSAFQKTLAINDWYRGSLESDLPLGSVQMMGRSDAATIRGLFPHRDAADVMAHSLDFWLTAEDLPSRENRVVVEDGRIVVHQTKANAEAYDRLERALKNALDRADPRGKNEYAGYRLGVAGVSHQCGTLVFGHDPSSSVLDADCRAHDVANLYAVDASFFPSSGAVNPSLTIMANALRVGDRILERFR